MEITQFIDYLNLEKKYAAHTLAAYERDLLQFEEFLQIESPQTKLIQADKILIRNYLIHLTKGDFSKRSINRKLATLRTYYKYGLQQGVLTKNPMESIDQLKVEKKVTPIFSEKEMSQLFDQGIFKDDFNGVRDKLILDLLYQTGMRRAELIGLKISDIDFYEKQIKILGKRNKERIVPIGESLLLEIKNYINRRKEKDIEQLPFLLITEKGKKIYEKLVHNIVNYYLSTVSEKQKKSPHVLRHTFATHMLHNGADLNTIKELLGHAGLAATQVYTHNDIENLKKVFNQSHPRGKKN